MFESLLLEAINQTSSGGSLFNLGVADWVIWYMILQYVGMAFFGGYFIYTARFKIGFRAVFYRRVGGGERALEGEMTRLDPIDVEYGYKVDESRGGQYQFVGEKDFRSTDKVINFRKGSFIPDLEHVCNRRFGYQILNFDFDTGSILKFGGEVKNVDPRVALRHLKHGVLERFLLQAGSMPTMILVMFAVIVVCGVAQ